MPQKRNPYLLEHVQGRTATTLGVLTEALAATRNAAFSNSIAAGTEAIRGLWRALQDATDVGILLRLVVAGARPCPERMLARANEGFANATAVALKLVKERDMDFRSAHTAVGRAISAVMAKGGSSLDSQAELDGISLESVTVEDCVNGATQGGGPAPSQVARQLRTLHRLRIERKRHIEGYAERWARAERSLDEAVTAYCGI
jgi:argininosuccinate lyase